MNIGGAHIAGGLMETQTKVLLKESCYQYTVDTGEDSQTILNSWETGIQTILNSTPLSDIKGIGITMPGFFDYKNGISLIRGLSKYDALCGMNMKEALRATLHLPVDSPVYFENDAICFVLNEYWNGDAPSQRVLTLILGIGLGSVFIDNDQPLL